MKIAQTEADLRAQLHITEQQKNTRGRLLTKAEERIAAVRKLHRPLDPSMKHTYCDECSPQWGSETGMIRYPCHTIRLLDS